MPLPTEAAVKTAISNWNKTLQGIVTPAATFDTNEAAYLLSVPADANPAASAASSSPRAAINAALGGGRGALEPLLTTYFKVLGFSYTSFLDGWQQLFDNMAQNSKFVKSRQFTRGAPAAVGSPSGTGVVKRLTTDRYGNPIETGLPEVKVSTCVADQYSGASLGSEQFAVRGAAALKDGLVLAGTGLFLPVTAIGGSSPTSSFITNQSFDLLSGTPSVPTDITGWTSSVAVSSGTYTFDEVHYYRSYLGVATPRALNMLGNCKLSQALKTAWDPTRPAYFRIAYNREVGSADGTLTIRIGKVSKAVTLAAQTGWNILRIDATADAWFQNWDEQGLDVEIEWSSRSTGQLLIDDALLVPWNNVDGTYIVIDPGATAFLAGGGTLGVGDSFNWTDTAIEAGVNQYWFVRALGLYLPATTGGSITWADA